MIHNFASKTAQDIFDGVLSRHARKIDPRLHKRITRLFDQINAVMKVELLAVPPSNRLKKLSGNLREFWSIRVNQQWRIIFRWQDKNAFDVDVVDYH